MAHGMNTAAPAAEATEASSLLSRRYAYRRKANIPLTRLRHVRDGVSRLPVAIRTTLAALSRRAENA
ncbi:MAG: hypothetical protein HY599_02770 [Candidatus Omnitrophica bacterium]|nr:hypothetical protein [Candidatus Omnitrophota bacterium]